MKLCGFLIVVKDIKKSKKYYHDLFGLELIQDNDGNMILDGGLVLQEERYWQDVPRKRFHHEEQCRRTVFRRS